MTAFTFVMIWLTLSGVDGHAAHNIGRLPCVRCELCDANKGAHRLVHGHLHDCTGGEGVISGCWKASPGNLARTAGYHGGRTADEDRYDRGGSSED